MVACHLRYAIASDMKGTPLMAKNRDKTSKPVSDETAHGGGIASKFVPVSEDVIVDTETGNQMMPARDADPLGVPARVASTVLDGIKAVGGVMSKVPSVATKVSDGIGTVAYRLRDGGRAAARGVERAVNGYDRYDTYDAGSFMLRTVDDALTYVVRHPGCLPWLSDDDLAKVEDASSVISAKRILAGGDYYDGEVAGDDAVSAPIRDFGTTVSDAFPKAWDWVGQHVMCPAGGAMVARRRGIGAVVASMERMSGRRGRASMASFPADALVAFSDALDRMSSSIHGYKPDYVEAGDMLRERGDEWLDRQGSVDLMMLSVTGKGHGDLMRKNGDGTVQLRTNREIGADFAAWFDDLRLASDVLGAYGRWIGGQDLREAVETFGDDANRDSIDDGLRREFLRVWGWIGRHIDDLWD